MNSQMEIYRGEEGEIVFNVDKEKDTIWATQAQIAELFGVQRAAITKHLNNIFSPPYSILLLKNKC